MLKIFLFFFMAAFISACNILPGLQNPDTARMHIIKDSSRRIQPTLIPITSAYLVSHQPAKYIYYIAPADVLNITVWQHPEFSTRDIIFPLSSEPPSTEVAAGREGYLVNSEGYIYFPLLGNILAAGKTVDEVRLIITKRLKKYVKRPEINVRISDFRGRRIYVLGEVLKPRSVPLSDKPLNITDALLNAGGVDQNAADPGQIYVIRGKRERIYVYWLNAKTPVSLLLGERFYLQPNDILYVSSAPAARWNRIINQLLPTIQTVWYTQSIVNNG